MPELPKALRLHIGLFGMRNAGKSSLINRLTGQNLSIVSDIPGTTTDPVEKACELHPIGPVVFIDTAGIDDTGELGALRVGRSLSVMQWVDLALVVIDASAGISVDDENLLAGIRARGIPAIAVLNKADRISGKSAATLARSPALAELCALPVSSLTGEGIEALRAQIARTVSETWQPDRPLTEGLVPRGGLAVLVTPIDFGAPKGRLIQPQTQTIRELIDQGSRCIVVREDQVAETLSELKRKPDAVITDSQAIKTVAGQVPEDIALTTFSILMARSKSDLTALARATPRLNLLRPGERILISETCSHNPQGEDIGRVKIPNWIARNQGGAMDVSVAVSKDFPADLTPFSIVIQCGGCMVTRRHMLARLRECIAQGVPMTNYGLAISELQGVLERTLSPFPEALSAYRSERERLERSSES
ncbi:MAG: [Duodenibacillus sp.]|nr:[FeFe] hydrogenase H-cluster maturation GTPase HydF [Duodenibacillus sp.]